MKTGLSLTCNMFWSYFPSQCFSFILQCLVFFPQNNISSQPQDGIIQPKMFHIG